MVEMRNRWWLGLAVGDAGDEKLRCAVVES
jgi:hypothetical protein